MSTEHDWSPVRRVRTHEQVVEQIQAKILDGHLRVGEKLPSERELVAALGVSRASVREALRALEAIGIIDARSGSGRESGATISSRSPDALGNLLRLHVALADIDLADLIEVRIQLERYAAAEAAAHYAEDDIHLLTSHQAIHLGADIALEEFNEIDTDFHVTISRLSGNTLAATLMHALRYAVKSHMEAVFVAIDDWRTAARQVADEHAAITEAITARRSGEAADLVEEHIRTFYRTQLSPRGAHKKARPGRLPD